MCQGMSCSLDALQMEGAMTSSNNLNMIPSFPVDASLFGQLSTTNSPLSHHLSDIRKPHF